MERPAGEGGIGSATRGNWRPDEQGEEGRDWHPRTMTVAAVEYAKRRATN